MHIYIPWWIAAFAPIGIGCAVAWAIPYGGHYDFVSPLLGLGAILIGVALTVGLFIGHFA